MKALDRDLRTEVEVGGVPGHFAQAWGHVFNRGSIYADDLETRIFGVDEANRLRQPPRVSNSSAYNDPRLKTSSHDFLRCDWVRHPLQPPYDGPCQVLSLGDKTFKILLNGREETVSVDRLKASVIDTRDDISLSSKRDWYRPVFRESKRDIILIFESIYHVV